METKREKKSLPLWSLYASVKPSEHSLAQSQCSVKLGFYRQQPSCPLTQVQIWRRAEWSSGGNDLFHLGWKARAGDEGVSCSCGH